MEIKKISDLPLKEAAAGSEHVLVEDGGAAKRIPVSAFAQSNEEKTDYSAFGIPVLELTGDTSAMDKDNAVTLDYTFGDRSGTLTCKWQGSSSLAYPKKNYTVKFDGAFEAKDGWGAQSKYCLKANWVDASALRNVFGAYIWGRLVKTREGADARLAALPNGGATDGFPVWVTINGQPQGLYTWTIPKDAWMFGMTGVNSGEGFVCAERVTLEGPVVCDGTDFDIEYAAGDKAALVASLNHMIEVLGSVQSADDLPMLEAVVDIDSVVDYYVLMAALCHDDGISRNYILGTYDGVKWFMSAYDMDATFGNAADGSGYGWANDWPMFSGVTGTNKLLDTVKTYYAQRIKDRFVNLRYWEFGDINLQSELYKQAIPIPEILRMEDLRLWPSRPGSGTNNLNQIIEYMRLRMSSLDYNVTQA